MHLAMQNGVENRRRLGVVVGVGLIHAALVAGFAFSRQDFPPEPLLPPVLEVLMMRLPPQPPQDRDVRVGGGAPATPSRIHRPPDPPVEKAELVAPLIQAPLQTLETGLAAVPTVESGMGLGGEGQGTGDGVGDGHGEGSGRGTGPVLVQGPRGAAMTANVSRSSLAALPGPYAVLQCYIRVGRDRLEGCRVSAEHPAGAGVGQAALLKSREFRYRPPSRVGRSRDRYRQIIAVAFPPPPASPTGVDGGRH